MYEAKCVDFFGSERRQPWEKFQRKCAQKSNWIIGQICIILTTGHIGPMLTTVPIRWIQTTSHIRQGTVQTARTKRIGQLIGHQITRNTMIEELEARCMSKYFFDYDDGDFIMSVSDNIAMDSEGNLMVCMCDNMMMDMQHWDIHITSSWGEDEET